MAKTTLKAFALLGILLIALVAVSGIASAVRVDGDSEYNGTLSDTEDARNEGDLIGCEVLWVKIDGDIVENGVDINTNFERDQNLDIKVKLLCHEDNDFVEVSASVFGNEHEKLVDSTDVFDVQAETIYTKSLSLSLNDLVEEDDYKLRVIVGDRFDAIKVYNYNLHVDALRHSVKIRDVTFTPDSEVRAGRALLTVVRVQNLGEKDEDSVKVKVSIPALGISATDYIDELESEDSVSSEELYMRIPDCAEEGEYTVRVTVDFDDGYDTTSKDFKIYVVESDTCGAGPAAAVKEKTVITVGAESQDLTKGKGGVVYPISLSNEGTQSKGYTISVDGADFATVKISPANVLVLNGGESKTVYVYLTANDDAPEGPHPFTVTITSGSESQQISLNANVVKGESAGWDSVKKGLEVGLIVLVVLLIILGLIIGFTKLKSDDEEEDEAETYY
ncbi:hypothetical protein JW968_05005 [Candidatus Woesearchaeota archaeon]|nr:hypothetical protein [Candidatus Woesearchaeota archaeon]